MENGIKKLELVLLVCALIAILGVAVSAVHSFDVFWQLQSGRYMVETGAIIDKDVFTLAPDVARYEHCWLHDIALYLIYLTGGYAAISVWKGVMVLATTLLLLAAAKTRGASLTAMLATVPLLFLTAGGWLERPQLWTFLCFAWFVFCLERYRVCRSKLIYSLFPVILFWANAHAGAVLGVLVFGAYLAGDLLTNLWKERRLVLTGGKQMLLAAVLVAVGVSLTPRATHWLDVLTKTTKQGGGGGQSAVETARQTGNITKLFNMDWTPTTFAAEPLFFYAIAAVLVVMVLGYKRLSLSDLFLLGGLAFMGLSLVRHIPFFYFGCLAILPIYLDQTAGYPAKFIKEPWTWVVRLALLVVIVYGFWVLYQPLYRSYGLFNAGLREWHYPIEATEFVQKHNLPANIYNTYDWGGYMAWKLFPEYQVFWDGRQISAEMFSKGWNVMAAKPGWQQILADFNVNTIVYRPMTIDTGQLYPFLDQLRVRQDWPLVFSDDTAMIFVRAGSVPEDWLAKHTLPKSRMNDTILATAHLMLKVNPQRYMAWWEMARVYLNREQYRNAHAALQQHLARTPQPGPGPRAQQIYRELTLFLNQQSRRPAPAPR